MPFWCWRLWLEDAAAGHVVPGSHLVCEADGHRPGDVLWPDFLDVGHTQQAHSADHLRLEDLQHAHEAVLTARSQAPRLEAADGHSLRSHGDCFYDVGT